MSTEKKLQIRNSTAEFLIFTGQSGEQSIEARYEDESVWLTQKLMAALFAVDVRTISEHLGNLFASAELQEEAVIRKFRTTASDGKNYNTQFYNLDAIISVGYRVNSVRATRLRDHGAVSMNFFDREKARKFCMYFKSKIMQTKFAYNFLIGIIRTNNTPQAYLPEHRRDAQTGGLLISGVGNAL